MTHAQSPHPRLPLGATSSLPSQPLSTCVTDNVKMSGKKNPLWSWTVYCDIMGLYWRFHQYRKSVPSVPKSAGPLPPSQAPVPIHQSSQSVLCITMLLSYYGLRSRYYRQNSSTHNGTWPYYKILYNVYFMFWPYHLVDLVTWYCIFYD